LLDWSELKTPIAKILERVLTCKPSPLWHRDEARDGYQINDYLKYNPSREEVLRTRESARKRQEHSRESRKQSRDGHAVTSSEVTRDIDVTSCAPVPVPVPVPEIPERSRGDAAVRDLVVVDQRPGQEPDMVPTSGHSPIPLRCNPWLIATPGMIQQLKAIGCLDPVAEVHLYALRSVENGNRHVDWTETGNQFGLWLARHKQMGCAGGRKPPVSAVVGKQDRSFTNLDNAAATIGGTR
jgi:hypothetical protein